MSRFSMLPFDTSTQSILYYIQPQDLDTYCCSDDNLHQYCRQPKNIEHYLQLRGLNRYLIKINQGLAWTSREGSEMLVNYFLFRGATNYNEALYFAAGGGRSQIVNQMLSLGATDYNDALYHAAEGGHSEIVNQMFATAKGDDVGC